MQLAFATVITRHRSTALLVGVAACLLSGVGPAAASASSPTAWSGTFYTPCDVDPSVLPHTADAAAAWLSTCYDIDKLPRTPMRLKLGSTEYPTAGSAANCCIRQRDDHLFSGCRCPPRPPSVGGHLRPVLPPQ